MADDLQELRAALRADVAEIAKALLGPPNKAASTRRTLRWGSKGSLTVEVSGPRKGLWFSHESDEGGDLLGLIQHAHGCDFAAAVARARNWTGDQVQPVKAWPRPVPGKDKADAAEAERARKIAAAQRIAAGGVPLAGTLGAYRLRNRCMSASTAQAALKAGVERVSVESGGVMDLAIVRLIDMPDLMIAALTGDADARALLGSVEQAVAGIQNAPRRRPMLCAVCLRP